LEIYFSVTDDLSQLEEKSLDSITENGKLLKYTSDDHGWCTGVNCTVFFVLSARAPGNYLISTKSTSRKEVIPD